METSLDSLNQTFELSEKYLGIGSCVPLVNYFSSTARYYLGIAQIVGGIAAAIFYHSSSIVITDVRQQLNDRLYVRKSIEYIHHGALNIARSHAEAFSFIVSLALVAYDLTEYKILKYSQAT